MIKLDLMRNVLVVAVMAGLLFLSAWVLLPFMAAGVWAAMIVVATWPLLMGLQRLFGGKRIFATVIMTLAIVLLLIIPLWLAITAVIEHSTEVSTWSSQLISQGLPPAPDWVSSVPVVGDRVAGAWNDLSAGGTTNLFQEYVAPHLTQAGQWALGQIGGLGGVLISFFLMAVLAALMYQHGEQGADLVKRVAERLGGANGLAAVTLTGQAIRSVALGVFVTALVQSLLGTIVLAIAGIPYAGFMGAVMLMLCVAQIGPSPVLVPVVVWMFWQGDSMGWSIFLAVAGGLVIMLDNFLRPYLIRRGADLPLLLILLGVIGGMLTFGLIGIFVGPVVLAVTYTLMMAWVEQAKAAEVQQRATSGISSPNQEK
ncbi:MAG TPA: AI-2E family transporter YdiK [Orrella sp.]